MSIEHKYRSNIVDPDQTASVRFKYLSGRIKNIHFVIMRFNGY